MGGQTRHCDAALLVHLLAVLSTEADTVGGHRVMHKLRCRSAGASAVDIEYAGRLHGAAAG